MPVSCAPGSSAVLYDWAEDLNRHEYWFTVLMMITGLDPSKLEEMTIDEYIDALRKTYNYILVPDNKSEEESYSNDMFSIYPFVSKNYKYFIHRIRVSWQGLTLCKYLEQA